MQDMLDSRKRGDTAFRDKDFKTAIDCYTQVLIFCTPNRKYLLLSFPNSTSSKKPNSLFNGQLHIMQCEMLAHFVHFVEWASIKDMLHRQYDKPGTPSNELNCNLGRVI